MAYLNANIPVTYAQIRREYLYDLKKHHGEVEDCIIFAMASITGRPILFHAIMENGAIFYRLPISAFIQRGLMSKKFLGLNLTSWSFGIVSVTILLSLLSISQTANTANTQEKTKNGIQDLIFLLLTGPTQRVIYQIQIILKYRTNISALIYLPWMMATMRLSQTID